MNKKGLHFVDWAISLGIFLIAVVAIFVYLQPGARPKYEGATLTSIVEEKFVQDTKMIVKQTPLFIRLLTQNYPAGTGTATSTIDISIHGDYNFGNMQPDPRKEVPKKIKGRTDRVNLHLECNLALCEDLSYVLSYFPVPQSIDASGQQATLELKCIPQDRNYCNAELGSTIDIEGISAKKARELMKLDYQQVKERWHFPADKEFAIYAYTKDNQELSVKKGPEPPLHGSVFVKESNYWVVNSEGIIEPVTINIRVW